MYSTSIIIEVVKGHIFYCECLIYTTEALSNSEFEELLKICMTGTNGQVGELKLES